MRHDKLERELYLIELLTENRSYTVNDLCDKVGISRRNLYYYLEFFKDCDFKIYKHGNYHYISKDSPYFRHITERITFTEEEAIVMRRLLEKTRKGNALIENLKKKLDRFYDLDILTNDELREQTANNIHVLYEAIKLGRQVVLRKYSSPHSKTKRDRLVEPFMLLDNNNEVRCFEPASGLNKTFKASRMQSVEMLDTEWIYADKHRKMYTDVFLFSGEERMTVRLVLGELAYNIMKEEYPKTREYISNTDDGGHLLEMEVCSYAGIGRFVLGLYHDIKVLGDNGFKEYLREKIVKMHDSIGDV
ncbi:MAG: WYL domain-containing transcriptional regulator [Prevotellaceae bacterium]|nr:WYL domain-containing transcriptional regulator [Prevotellaceae bacterium]